ncbi:MAG TPA: alpha-glucuronidase family glycosyl hydrolase [Pyrinomonadaceae bacterium]|nr:alpha-glucuronidase family glycosyl hydrolase [Pyrinomonadaceae bacterium]
MTFAKSQTGTSFITSVVLAIILFTATTSRADDGYRLWLRYDPLPQLVANQFRSRLTSIVVAGNSDIAAAIRSELANGLTGLLGTAPATKTTVTDDATLLIGTPASSSLIARLRWDEQLSALGPEGYVIRSARIGPHSAIVIASQSDVGALYGSFAFLRLLQTQQPIANLNVSEKPRLRLRVLDHWDNLDGSIERGYAGQSLWNWSALPNNIDPRLRDYARANASIGINGSTLNNVNADAQILTPDYLKKVAAIANVFRAYGLHVYLSARFSAPMELSGLKTADPLDPEVALWWKKKADEIYTLIPDFGGFVVKANSEGQPGPRTYNRTHADGANMLAAALAPHSGVVLWRAFVYDMKPGYDRAGAAFENLQPFDGKFAANVMLQVKNGPIDFQPREPFHPLFGAMPKTQVVPELQITQEYLGFSNHLVFLAQMWREFLDSDTHAKGKGSTVSKVVDGSLYGQRLTGLVGVANTGSDRNWTGHHFLQANWYAFGRLAWNPDLPSQTIADEWIRMTFTNDAAAVNTISQLMLQSWEALVDYMTPLGLHHIMWGKTHYGPAPWWDTEKREDWNPVYFHRADAKGIGFDRTATGSNTVAQYHPDVRDKFANLQTCPEKFLLWFHHVPWDHRMRSGNILWDEMALHYQHGVDWVRRTNKQWNELSGVIDRERHAAVASKLAIQERDAVWWRDACLSYFQTFSKRPLPSGVEAPAKSLEEYKAAALSW